MVQSHIIGSSFDPRLFSASLLVTVREAIAESSVFFGAAEFNVWKDLCCGDMEAFVGHYRSLYSRYLLERRKECESFYVECNKTNRRSRERQGSSSTEAGSATSSVVSSKKASSKIVSAKSAEGNVPVVHSSMKSVSKRGGTVSKQRSGASTSKGRRMIRGVTLRILKCSFA